MKVGLLMSEESNSGLMVMSRRPELMSKVITDSRFKAGGCRGKFFRILDLIQYRLVEVLDGYYYFVMYN